jgi:16S rRNA (guanine1207-N2)-methyltransferase
MTRTPCNRPPRRAISPIPFAGALAPRGHLADDRRDALTSRARRGPAARPPALAEGYRVATPDDIYFKKVVTFRHRDSTLRLRVAQELFSSHEVDVGTQRLLRSLLDGPSESARTVLDLGCGYGPIGLALKQADPARDVHLVDRDALAVEFTRQNAALNGLDDVQVYGSLGYADLRAAAFDLIASNIPAKAGEAAIARFLTGAADHLRPGGLVAIVVVSRLEALVDRILDRPEIAVAWRKEWPGHTTIGYRFTATPDPRPGPGGELDDLEPYWHGSVDLAVGGERLTVRVAASLPETDALDIHTVLAIEALERLHGLTVGRGVCFNPGQGHAPLAVWRIFRPAALGLIDRDLLALRVTRANLLLNGCAPEALALRHQVGLQPPGAEPIDLIAGILRDDEGPAAHAWQIDQAADQLAPGGALVAVGSSTAVARLETAVRVGRRLKVDGRQRRKGRGALVMRRA